jgi:hypothetical protein
LALLVAFDVDVMIEAEAAAKPRADPFGAAKPVDTQSKLLELERKLETTVGMSHPCLYLVGLTWTWIEHQG